MFWKKKSKQPEQEIKGLSVMPDEFYGGKDPVVHYVKTEKTVGGPAIKPKTEKPKKLSLGEAVHGVTPGISAFFHKKSLLIIVISIISVSVLAGISWYYVYQAQETARQRQALAPKVEPPKLPPKEESVPVVEPASVPEPEPTPIQEIPTTTEQVEKNTLDFPLITLAESADNDNDSLSNLEEEAIGTDSEVWDTDSDGYYDGLEVFNLYNPKGFAPMRIIDSGLVKEYINPVTQYRLFYPAQWSAAAIDETADRVLLSALSGDYIEVVSEQMWSGESFVDWFGRRAVGQLYSDLQQFNNRFKEDGLKRKDDLTAYFSTGNKVFILIYHPGITGDIAYRHIMQMIMQSFRPAKTLIQIPEQTIMPGVTEEPITTTTPPVVEATGTEEMLL